jgi:non-ribosomal peptide synthetase component F
MDPNSPRLNSHHRTAAISLIHANEWQLAGKYAKAWSQRARSHSDHMDALWHQAIVHKRLESWSDVIRCCQQANEFANKNNADVAQHDWNGLTKFAKQKFGEMDAKPTIVSE